MGKVGVSTIINLNSVNTKDESGNDLKSNQKVIRIVQGLKVARRWS